MSQGNTDIHNTGGPGSGAEPSMEEILASIRRILKEDDTGANAPHAAAGPTYEESAPSAPMDLDDDVLLLDQSMIAKPADVSSATTMPYEPMPAGEHATTPMGPAAEPVHFSSAPEQPSTQWPQPAAAAPYFEAEPVVFAEPAPAPAPRTMAAAMPPAAPYFDAVPQPEPVAAPRVEQNVEPPVPDPEPMPPEPAMSDHNAQENVHPPQGLMSEKTTDAAASSIGALVRSISSEKSVALTSRSSITIEDIVREEIRPLLKSWLDSHLPSLVERVVRSEIERVIDRSAT